MGPKIEKIKQSNKKSFNDHIYNFDPTVQKLMLII